MRTSRPTGGLDRSAASDLWRNTLSQIPSVIGRLAYLASLRDPNSGRYEHHGLALVFGDNDANKTLKKSHTHVFREWLTFNLEQQQADLELYLSGLEEEKRTILANWLELAPYRNFIPITARPVERRLYLADIKALLKVMGNAHGVESPDPNA